VSFFDGDVIAKEQLHGVIGAAVTVPPIPAPTPTGAIASGFPYRKPSPLSLIITPDGQVLLNLDIQKRERRN
jgi:hypothetical protein